MGIEIIATAIICALTLGFGHYFPWKNLFGKDLKDIHVVCPYIYGVLAIAFPLSGFMAVNGFWASLIALWATIIAGGLTVLLCYWLDSSLENRRGRREAEEREALARKQQEGCLNDQGLA